MITLPSTLKTWQKSGFSEDFKQSFKQEFALIEHKNLPLQQGLSLSSYVSNEKISAIIHNTDETENYIIVKSGVFYTGIIAGCSCSDDPTPLDTQNEYCDLMINIDKLSAEATVILITD